MKRFFTNMFLFATFSLFAVTVFGQSQPFFGTGSLANPNKIEYVQPDGSLLSFYLKGDAVINWGETPDGYKILQNNKGVYEYATVDLFGNMIPSGIQASSQRNSTEQNFVSTASKDFFFSKTQISQKKSNSKLGKGYTNSKMGGFPTTGTRKLLMILANFSNTSTGYTQTNFDNYMNQVNYNGTGSFKDYYLENSYGQLTVNTTVTVWVTVPNTHNYYGPEAKWAEFVRDAVNAADAAGVDFTQFDNDGNGTVDGVAVIHQGVGQEESGSTSDIWSHNWSLSAGGFSVTKDGKTVDAYTCQPEKSGSSIATIGVMCHEFGHNLGAPDYYDTDYATGGQYTGTGKWDMMAEGSYNGSPGGSKPAHHNAYTKSVVYGWLNPTTISSAANITMTNVEQNKTVYKYTTNTSNEYFLCENRQLVGFDAGLPGHGLIVYHVDGTYISNHMDANDINATSHQGMYPKAAGGTINAATCPFPGTGAKTSFTDATTPNSKSWAAANTAKPITSIVETGGNITFAFMGGGSVTPTAPTATSVAASSIGTTTATLNATINNNSAASTTISFEYGTTTSYGSTATATPSSATGSTAVSALANLTGLTANTTYNFRVKAVNSVGTTYGSNLTFTTTAVPTSLALPLTENFNASTIPANWTTQNEGTRITERWTASNTANAGGTAYEMKCTYQNLTGTTRLITPALNTTGLSTIALSAKYMLDDYGTGATLKVQTSTNKTTWTDASWSLATAANSNKTGTISINLTSNLNSSTTYIAFVVTGNLNQIDYWYVDNVSVTSSTTPVATLATVTTNSISAITTTTATSGGNVTADGGATVTAKGVCWSTTTSPTIANSKTSNGTATGTFTSSLTGLTANTTYYVRAYATNSVGTAYGPQQTFTTSSSTAVAYCASKGTNVTYEWIDLVQIGTLNNATTTKPSTGYSDFTALAATTLALNTSKTIYVSAGFASTAYTEYFKVYIDYNKNGVFTDAGELVASTSSSLATTLSMTFTVPSTATVGTTRMRVVMSDASATTSCGTYSYGETEDYIVNISSAKSGEVEPIVISENRIENYIEHITLYPVPANNVLNVVINAKEAKGQVSIYNLNGQVVFVQSINTSNTELNISKLPAGVYMVKVDDGEKGAVKQIIKK